MTNKQKFETLCGTITASVSTTKKQYPFSTKYRIAETHTIANVFVYNHSQIVLLCRRHRLFIAVVVVVGVAVAKSNNYSVCSGPVSEISFLSIFFFRSN